LPVLGIRTLDDVSIEGKTVLLRVDINCPLDDAGKITDSSRIKACAPTVSEIAERNARVVVLAHQGRTGKPDCISLSEHAKLLGKEIEQEVTFVPKASGPEVLAAIENARLGDVLLLENQRFDKGEGEEKPAEEHAKDPVVTELAKLADFFVNDAFAAAHRSQRSLVGFCPLLPSAMGRLMEEELSALSKLLEPERPAIFIFGGAKTEGIEELVGTLLASSRADKVLLAGLTGLAFVVASGHALGASDQKIHESVTLQSLVKMSELLEKYPLRLIIPSDHAVESNDWRATVDSLPTPYPILDIGEGTIGQFVAEIKQAKTIFISGPPGFFEKPAFETGTRTILSAIGERTAEGAHTVVGGGHTNAAVEKFGLGGTFSYQSTGGGALETFITGGEMPVVEALKNSKA
jgi:phosphoglycerate kinase